MAKKAAATKARAKKKDQPSKSDQIRSAMEVVGPSVKPIQELLASKGVEASYSLVAGVLGRAGKKKTKGKRRGRKPGTASNGHFKVDSVLQAKVYVGKVGSIGEAKAALELLQRITG